MVRYPKKLFQLHKFYKPIAPEVFEGYQFSEKSDVILVFPLFKIQNNFQKQVWAFGVTLFELFSYGKEELYPGLTNEQIEERVKQGKPLKPLENFPEIIKQLMKLCFESQVKERKTFGELLIEFKNLTKH